MWSFGWVRKGDKSFNKILRFHQGRWTHFEDDFLYWGHRHQILDEPDEIKSQKHEGQKTVNDPDVSFL